MNMLVIDKYFFYKRFNFKEVNYKQFGYHGNTSLTGTTIYVSGISTFALCTPNIKQHCAQDDQ